MKTCTFDRIVITDGCMIFDPFQQLLNIPCTDDAVHMFPDILSLAIMSCEHTN